MKHLYIIAWELCAKNGLNVSYSLNGVNQYVTLNAWDTTRLLFDVGLIQGRKKENGIIKIMVIDMWASFRMFVDRCKLLPCEIKILVLQHLENQLIVNAPFSLLSFKEPCLN